MFESLEERCKMRDKSIADTIRAMDKLARCVNDEELFVGYWLALGVPDESITDETTDDEILDMYPDKESIEELTEVFLNLMVMAQKDGGLII